MATKANAPAPQKAAPRDQATVTPTGNPTVTPFVEGRHDGGFIVSEANGHQSRDTITLTGGAGGAGIVAPGTVLGFITASNKWAPLNLTASDGSETAAGLLFGGRDVTTADTEAVAITRQAEVNGSELFWPTGATSAQIATATAQLQQVGILVR